jgi:hypothetical protein
MILYVDNENKVRAVNTTTDTSLTPLYVDETADLFPFKGWSTAKICCYKVTVSEGIVTMMTPYVDSRNLEMIDTMGHTIDAKASTSAISDTETIGTPSSKTYEKDDTFMGADGLMYKASTKIWCGSKLVNNGNCELTTINAELAKIKEGEK